jgi:hypothetical protein
MGDYNIKPQKVDLHRKHFMSFQQFLASGAHLRFKNKDKCTMSDAKPLRETIGNFRDEIDTTMFSAIPRDAEDRDVLLHIISNQIRNMSSSMDLVITVVGLVPAENQGEESPQ